MPDPTSLIGGAVSGGLQSLGGLLQFATAGVKKKERNLENFSENSPTYTPNQGIMDYYQKALGRYNPNAYNSAAYQQGQTNINSNLASGINATQDRRAGLAGISNLVAQSNRASLANVANAEKIQGQNLNQLGNASRAKLGEDRMAFKINQQDPFERKYNLLAMKAAAAAKQKNDGLQNIFGGLSNGASLMAGSKSSGSDSSTGNSMSGGLLGGLFGG